MSFKELFNEFLENETTIIEDDENYEHDDEDEIIDEIEDLLYDLDLDELLEVKKYIFDKYDFSEEDDELDEAVKTRVVVRNGRKVRKKFTDREGYKVNSDGKEVKMSVQEIRNRRVANRKSKNKRKAKSAQANRKRQMSLRRK